MPNYYQECVFPKINSLLIASRLSLLRKEIRSKHSEGVVWAQNEGHFGMFHFKKTQCRLLVWPLWIFIVWVFPVTPLTGGTTHDLLIVRSCYLFYRPLTSTVTWQGLSPPAVPLSYWYVPTGSLITCFIPAVVKFTSASPVAGETTVLIVLGQSSALSVIVPG